MEGVPGGCRDARFDGRFHTDDGVLTVGGLVVVTAYTVALGSNGWLWFGWVVLGLITLALIVMRT